MEVVHLGSISCPLCAGTGKTYDAEVTGAAMRGLREEAGVSLRTLARELKVSAAYLSRLERGLDKWPNTRVSQYVARLLNVKRR